VAASALSRAAGVMASNTMTACQQIGKFAHELARVLHLLRRRAGK
jgi:hypothetical protein